MASYENYPNLQSLGIVRPDQGCSELGVALSVSKLSMLRLQASQDSPKRKCELGRHVRHLAV